MKFFRVFIPVVFLFLNALVSAQSSRDIIKIDQCGYYTHAPKIAVVTSDYKTDEYAGSFGFYVLKANIGDTVYKGALGEIHQSQNSSVKTRIADFSSFQ